MPRDFFPYSLTLRREVKTCRSLKSDHQTEISDIFSVQDAHKQPTSIRMPACVVKSYIHVLDKKEYGICIGFLIIQQLNYCIRVGLNTPIQEKTMAFSCFTDT